MHGALPLATEPWYATRDDVMSALDVAETARTHAQIDRLIAAASRSIDSLCHRKFHPWVGTRYLDWPTEQCARGGWAWLDANEVIELTNVVSGGTTIASSDYFLYPLSGPPFTRLEIDLSSSATLGGGATHQRDLVLTGTFGYGADTATVGTLAEAVDTAETSIDLSSSVGVGTLLLVDNEYMHVSGRLLLTTGQTVNSALTASKGSTSVAVDDGTLFTLGEVITIDAERMLITDIAANSLIVERAWSGSTLAAHDSGSTVYAPRTAVVERAGCGTAAASHSSGATVYRHVPPALVTSLAVSEAVWALQNEQSGMARTVGEGEASRQVTQSTIRPLREQVLGIYGRKMRHRAV
jgi:hypothetical protein